jgi:hypothetical protein
MRVRHNHSIAVLVTAIGLAIPITAALSSASAAPNDSTERQTTALVVSAPHHPLRLTGSDGMVHLDYNLVFNNVFTTPVTLTSVEVLTPQGRTLLRLAGDQLRAMTQPMVGRTATDQVPASGTAVTLLDVVVPPDDIPTQLTHHITYALAPNAPLAQVIGSLEIRGPQLTVDHFKPVVIAPPLRGAGWINLNGCCLASAHRSARVGVDGTDIGTPETFAIDWIRVIAGRTHEGDGTRNDQYFAYGAELLAVANGTVAVVRDGIPDGTPNQPQPPPTVHEPDDFGGNQVILDIGHGVYAVYAHLQPGTVRVRVGDKVTTGQVLGLLGHSGNSIEPHLHFALADGPDALTANSLPFVIDNYTLAGSLDTDNSTPTDIRLIGHRQPETRTHPLVLTVADFR